MSQTDSAESQNSSPPNRSPRRPKWKLPIILFGLTCLSTFFVGATQYSPATSLMDCIPATEGAKFDLTPIRGQLVRHWDEGLLYMVLVMSILLAHEMGHYVATLIYKVPASLPIFLPFPFNPLGTFGAVIGMQGMQANRKQIFDIGIAGPLAGLVIAIPVMVIGVQQLEFSGFPAGTIAYQCPLGTKMMLEAIQPTGYTGQEYVWISQLNPFFAAGWVGFLITGVNMMPVSQLDGGHVTYTLFGRVSHWIARATMAFGIAFMVYSQTPTLVLMFVLLLLVGTDHPPTKDDNVSIGWFRTLLGVASLSIPIFCFPPLIFKW